MIVLSHLFQTSKTRFVINLNMFTYYTFDEIFTFPLTLLKGSFTAQILHYFW